MYTHDVQEEGYDVYVNEPQPLEEGQEKHLLSVFVADESGIINRVAGVFARRGQYAHSYFDHMLKACAVSNYSEEIG